MGEFYEIDQFVPCADMDTVLKGMGCNADSPVYEEVKEEYRKIADEMLSLAEPVGVLGFATLPESLETKEYRAGQPVIYAALSIGDSISQCSTKAFQEGDYLKGMLCDAIADAALFSMEQRLTEKLQEICREHKKGILRRLEAPQDLPMEVQEEVWEYLNLKERFGIDISSGFMFRPVKTTCQVFVLTDDEKIFRAQHNCRECPNRNCKFRNIPKTEVEISRDDKSGKIFVEEGESLLEGMIRQGYYLSAPCGGRGRCGKCRVQILKGYAPESTEDREKLTKKERQEGWRLSCTLYPAESLEISLVAEDESEFEIIGETRDTEAVTEHTIKDSQYEIAVDIGTTTIAMELLGRESGRKLAAVTMINSQRAYGADVISRIQASVEGKKRELQESIRKDLLAGMQKLAKEAGISLKETDRICIAGNTTMGHLLMGYDCNTLGVYPFEPVNIDFIKGTFKEIFDSEICGAEVILLPGISTFVGGDIVSGLAVCGFAQEEEICLLVDLGTNGEMAIGNKDRILVTSTAAGPAFEGGNITWGTGSVAGAICSVTIRDGKAEIKTIQDQKPTGICGTGVIETTMELVKAELVDETGRMEEEYFEDGFPLGQTAHGETIVFTNRDVREVQLAKAAIRAGVETLLLRYGVKKEDIARVYLAGGFGYKLDKNKAIYIGMLPEEFSDKIEAVGNSSLSGAVLYLKDEQEEAIFKRLKEVSVEISLSTDKDFNEFYMEHMMFDIS